MQTLVARSRARRQNWRRRVSGYASIEEELNGNRQVLESAAADLAVAQNELTLSQQEAAAATARSVRSRSRAGSLSGDHDGERRCRYLDCAINWRRAEERLAGIDREGQRLQAEIATSKSQVNAFGGQRGQLALEFETVSQRLGGLSDELLRVRQTLELKRREETSAKNSSRRVAG